MGRAGRGDRPGLAFIQTYRPDHRAIRAVVDGDAAAFYDEELALRERFGSPPFGRLVKLTVGLADRDAAEREATAMAERLRARTVGEARDVQVAGPAPAYVARRAERWRFNVVLRGADRSRFSTRRPVRRGPWTWIPRVCSDDDAPGPLIDACTNCPHGDNGAETRCRHGRRSPR